MRVTAGNVGGRQRVVVGMGEGKVNCSLIYGLILRFYIFRFGGFSVEATAGSFRRLSGLVLRWFLL